MARRTKRATLHVAEQARHVRACSFLLPVRTYRPHVDRWRGIIEAPRPESFALGQPPLPADRAGVPARHGDRGAVDQALPAWLGTGLPAGRGGDRAAVA